MNARNPFADVQKAAFSFLTGAALVPGLFILLLVLAFAGGRCSKATLRENRIVALRDTVRIADSVYLTRTDTVRILQRRVDTLRAESDRAQQVTDSIDRLVQQTDFDLPPLVVMDLQNLRYTVAKQDTTIHAQANLIRSLYGRDSTQEWRIATRDKLYAAELRKANSPRWGIGATCGVDPFDRSGRCVVGITYQVKLPSVRDLLQLIR